jgi:hypothetical protein
VYELSAECSHKNIDIIIENKINNLELGELSEIFQTTCPTGFNIKLKKKKKIIFLINKHSKTNKYFKIIISKKQIKIKNNFTTYNLIADTKEKKIIGTDGRIHKKNFDRCNDEDVNKGKLDFDIFSDYVQISTSSLNFLSEIYNLNDITTVVHFLSNSIDTLPIYSQRRLLSAIYDVYFKYIEFPKLLFCKKLLFILKNIYKINNLDENKILDTIDKNKKDNSEDLYSFFIKN